MWEVWDKFDPVSLWVIIPVVLITLGILLRAFKKIWKALAFSVGTGLLSMLLIHIISPWTGIVLPANLFTIGVSMLGGMPGVVSMLILRLIYTI